MQASDPKIQKKLGRTVKNFDEQIWNGKCREIVKKGNIAKVKPLQETEHLSTTDEQCCCHHYHLDPIIPPLSLEIPVLMLLSSTLS